LWRHDIRRTILQSTRRPYGRLANRDENRRLNTWQMRDIKHQFAPVLLGKWHVPTQMMAFRDRN
jgi:hypothetical protein